MKPVTAEGPWRMPAEWAAQDAVWLSWPPSAAPIWGETARAAVEMAFAALVALLSRYEPVCINVVPGEEAVVLRRLETAGADTSVVRLFSHPLNDVWCRDHGPIFVHDAEGNVCVTDWQFNAWGGKYPPWDADNAIPARIAESLGLPHLAYPLVLEGGAIDVNGAGLLLTTEAVMLNPNRNGSVPRRQQESILGRGLGIDEVIWLKDGIFGDDTDGHIDNLARFFGADSVIALVDSDRDSPNFAPLADNFRRLEEWRGGDGRSLNVLPLPAPEPVWVGAAADRRRLPASYANFLVINDAVIVPTFGSAAADDRSCGIIGDCFPGRRVEGFDSRQFLLEGGAVHCLTQQQPTKSASCGGSTWNACGACACSSLDDASS